MSKMTPDCTQCADRPAVAGLGGWCQECEDAYAAHAEPSPEGSVAVRWHLLGGIMQSYTVLYRREDIMAPADAPFAFQCSAEDTEHAEEQCVNAEPDADIVWVVITDDVQAAYADYWNTPAGFTAPPLTPAELRARYPWVRRPIDPEYPEEQDFLF